MDSWNGFNGVKYYTLRRPYVFVIETGHDYTFHRVCEAIGDSLVKHMIISKFDEMLTDGYSLAKSYNTRLSNAFVKSQHTAFVIEESIGMLMSSNFNYVLDDMIYVADNYNKLVFLQDSDGQFMNLLKRSFFGLIKYFPIENNFDYEQINKIINNLNLQNTDTELEELEKEDKSFIETEY